MSKAKPSGHQSSSEKKGIKITRGVKKKVRGSRELERELESSSSALLEETANCCSLSKKTQYLFLFLWRFIVDQDILLSEH